VVLVGVVVMVAALARAVAHRAAALAAPVLVITPVAAAVAVLAKTVLTVTLKAQVVAPVAQVDLVVAALQAAADQVAGHIE
jgi:hypothetical protein